MSTVGDFSIFPAYKSTYVDQIGGGRAPVTDQVVTQRRTRNRPATRSAILDAARNRFARDGYDGAALREIAAEVGVDPALVIRYFGSKEGLFVEALHCAGGGVEAVAQGPVADFGERVARLLVQEPRDDGKLSALLMILRSASSSRAAAVIRQNRQQNFYGPIEAWLGGGPEAAVKARLVAGIITGLAISRAVEPDYGLDAAGLEIMRRRVADLLQQAVA
jgi:AcrR family transcriptional regulator